MLIQVHSRSVRSSFPFVIIAKMRMHSRSVRGFTYLVTMSFCTIVTSTLRLAVTNTTLVILLNKVVLNPPQRMDITGLVFIAHCRLGTSVPYVEPD